MVVSMLPASALSVFAAEGTETSVTGTATIDLSQYSEGAIIDISEDNVIIGDGNEYKVSLNIAENATVTFEADTSGVKLGAPITVADGKTLTLLVAGDAEHTVNGGISLGNGSNVIIEGDLTKANNKLTVTATGSNAGIGANNGVTAGDITIRNARVDATGSGSSSAPKIAGAGIGTAKASMGNILIVNSIVTAAGGYYSEYEAHGAAIGMGSDGGTMGNITLIDSEITASHSGEGHASIIGAGPDFAEGDRDGSDIGTMGDIIITNTDLHLSMADSTIDEYAAMIGTADFSGGYSSYSVNMGKIIFTDIMQAQLDEMIATWSIPSDFAEYGGYVLGLGYWTHVYKYNEYEKHCVGTFGGVWVSDGNGGIVQIGNDDGYYVDCKDGSFVHNFDKKCGGTCSDCDVTYYVVHTMGTAATCTAPATCSVCGESYGELAEHTAEPTYTDNGDGTHKATYSCCGTTVTAAHNYKSGTPAGTCVCGAECPHSNFDSATGNCTDCETLLAIAKIETGETTTYYQTADELRTAISEIWDDQTVTLLADFETKNDFHFFADRTENIFDLNGHTLTCDDRIVVGNCKLTITGTDSSKIIFTGANSSNTGLSNLISVDDEDSTIVVGSVVIQGGILRSVYGGVLDLTNATIPEAGLNVILYTDDWEPATYNVSDVLLLPADYYFFVDGKAVSSYSEETVGTVLKHAEHSYTYTDNGDGTHDATCSACGAVVDNEAHSGGTATCTEQAKCEHCGASYGEVDPDNHDFGSGNTCICGAEIAFTGIVVDDENSDEYRYDETRKTYTIIIPADEVGGIGYLSYDIIGTNLTLIEDTNTLLKVQHENEDGLTPAPDDLLVDVLQDNGCFGWSVLGYGDGEWEKLLYSNDGGMTWTTYTFEVKQAYSITVNASQNGTVTANEYAIEGDNIALNVSPAEGYMLDTLSVTDASGNSVDVENNAFTMPASAVTVTATFAVCDHKDGRHETATDNGDGTHDATYSCCGTTVTEGHSGGTATCTEQAKCEHCGASYGELDPDNHASDTYTYTDNGDGTHTKTHECGVAVGEAEAHTIENHVCTVCGAMEIVVSFNAGDYEWKTGDTLYFCRVSGDNEWEEYAFTATVAEDGTVTWTPDRTLYWDGTGEHKLVVIYPDTGYVWDTWYIDEDQSTLENLRKNDHLNAIWSGNPTTDSITFNLKHRLAKVSVNYEIAEDVAATVSKAEIYSLTQYLLFDIDTLERRNVTWEEGYDLWINSYHNGNQFTAFVSPDAYAADGNFIKITLSDGTVYEVKMNKAVTFEEGAEYTYKVVITADGAYLTCADECSFEYTDNGDGTHDKVCTGCGYVEVDNEAHSGGTATCTEQAKCQHCGASYGEVDKNNHDETVAYVNGFCPNCDAFEPAELVDGVYEISNAGNLYWFADKVTNENAAYGSVDAILTCDIRVNEGTMTEASTDARVWTPIGKHGFGVNIPYTGTFEGNGKTVSGLYFNDTSANFSVGLFSLVGEGGKVQNVGIADSYLCGSQSIGAVAGSNRGTVTGCYNTGTVSGTNYVGGVVGACIGEAILVGCYNTGTVSGTSSVGGVAGSNHGTVTDCHNTGAVSGSSSVGGVVGWNQGTCTNCYFDSTVYTGDAIGNNYGTATDVEGKSTEQFAGGEVAYLLSQGENGSIWGQTIGTDPAPVFSDAKVYYGYTSCGDTVAKYTNDETISAEKPDHTQKPTYTDNGDGTHSAVYLCCGTTVTEEHDFENDAHQCVCGYACPHDSYTDGVCNNCGYECPHEWGEGVLTRPTFESEGYYTYTCTLCGEEKTETAEEADTTALNDASMKVMECIGDSTLTQEAANEIHNSYLDILKNNGNIFDEFGFVRGDLVEEDQPAINAVTAELEKIIADADEKIASGEYVKADYTEIDEAIDDIEEKLASENVTDEGKAELEEIKKQLEEMKADENTSKADLAELEKALEDYEEELDKGIEDGTLVEINVSKISAELLEEWKEKLDAEGLLDEYEDFINNQKATDEALAAEKAINDFMASLEGTVAENAENIAKLNEMNNSLCASFENCLRGTHNFKDYEVTSSAKCEVNAIETGTCWFCGETDEREVEGTALTHSFTKYEVTEEAECGKAGKEIAYCDHGCGATDEKEIPALTHKDEDGDYLCDHGCGYEFEKPVEPEQPDDSSEKCDHLCHKDGILGFLWKIIRFFYRLFNIQQYCDCGELHYDAPVFG